MATAELVRFTIPEVRDLAWVTGSPPLAVYTDSGGADRCMWPGVRWFRRWLKDFLPVLIGLEHDPGELLETVNGYEKQRLGTYFENLIAYRFEHDPRYRLLARNIQLRNHERTIGEFDFVVADTRTQRIFHVETSGKFYAGTGDTTRQHNWIGPNRADRFDRKTDHLKGHQLRIKDTEEGKRYTAENDITIDTVMSIMKGRLFYPFGCSGSGFTSRFRNTHRRPEHCPRNHDRGLHASAEHVSLLMERYTVDEWRTLPRSRWLSPAEPSWCEGAFTRKDGEQLAETMFRPFCIAGFKDGVERHRVLVLPESWYHDDAP